jgi:hypothetical protein
MFGTRACPSKARAGAVLSDANWMGAMCRHVLIKQLFDIFIKRWVGYRNTIPVIKGGFPIGI